MALRAPVSAAGQSRAGAWTAPPVIAVALGTTLALALVWSAPDVWRVTMAVAAVGAIGVASVVCLVRQIDARWRAELALNQRSDEAVQRAEAAAQANAELLQDALDALPDGFVIYDQDTRRVIMNRRFREIHAANPLSADPTAPLDQVLRAAIEAGELDVPPSADIDAWIRERIANHKSGSYEYVQKSSGRRIRILERKMHDGRMVAIHADISELKAAQELAETANRAKSQFLASMSHELRTPLNVVLGFAQLLRLNRPKNLTEDQKDHVQRILSSGEHLLSLINEVLDLSGIEAGKLKLAPEWMPVDHLIEDIRRAMIPVADRGRVTLTSEAAAGDVYADPTRLRQVMLNLVSNAIKYNRENGTVRITAIPSADGRVRFRVVDTGRGIAADQQPNLFQPFRRLGAELGPVEGTGIGLAISKRLVEAMGGTIGFESIPGVGSTFWFDLTSAPHVTAQARGPGAVVYRLPYVSTVKRSVLCIEDNAASLELVERMFSTMTNIRMLSAETSQRGLALASAERPDLILLDINLPDMDGYEFLAQLKRMPATKDIPVLALTALAMPHDMQRGLRAGFLRYITKPIDMNALLAAVQEALDKRPVRQAAAEP
jgi:signal transduction histidine kinase/ActR/RegA family two-component response regulator